MLYSIASIHEGLKEPEEVLATYDQVLEFQQAQKNLAGQADTFIKIAEFYNSSKQSEKALTAYNQALTICNQLLGNKSQEDLVKQARAFSNIPRLYDDLSQSEKELIYKQPSLQPHLKAKEAMDKQAPHLDYFYQTLILIKQPGKDVGRIHEIQSIQAHSAIANFFIDTIFRLYRVYKQPNQELFEQFKTFATIQKNLYTRADILLSIAEIHKNGMKEPEKALDAYNQALVTYNQLSELHQAEKNLVGRVSTLNSIALIYISLKQSEKALASYNQLLEVQQIQKDLMGQSLTLDIIANLYDNLNQTERKIDTYNQKLTVYYQIFEVQKTQNDYSGLAQTLHAGGFTFLALGQFQRALDNYNQGLDLLQMSAKNLSGSALISNRSDQAAILFSISTAYKNLGDSQKSLAYLIQAHKLELADEKNPQRAAETLNAMSRTYIDLGERQLALDALKKAFQLQQQTRDFAGESKTRRNIAEIYLNSGELQKALDEYNQALAIQNQAADLTGQAQTLNAIADLYTSLGDSQLSLNTYSQALQLAQQSNAYQEQAYILAGMGDIYAATGKYNEALKVYNQALELNRSHSLFVSSDLSPLMGIARVYNELRDYPKALAAARSILEISRQTGFGTDGAKAVPYVLMGEIYMKKGDYQQALVTLEQARPLLRQWHANLEAKALDDMGQAYAALKQYPKAIATYNLALTQTRRWGNRPKEAETHYFMAVTERNRGDLKAAQTRIEEALTVVENLRTKVANSQLRASYFASVQKYYEFYIDLLMQLHKQQPSKDFNALALQVSERARARSLLELLKESQADIRQGVDPKLLEQEKNLQFQFNALEKRRLELGSKTPTKAQITSFEREYDTLLSQDRDLETQIRSKSPRYAALTQPKPLTIAEIQQQVLDNNTVLLEYSLGKERSYLWAVTQSGIISYELPKQSEIEAATNKFLNIVQDSNAKLSDISRTGTPLSQMLLGPVAQQLGQKRLLVVSDGALQYLPFAALPAPKGSQFLLSEHEIINLPSASTLATLRQELNGRKPAPKTVAVFADPVFSPTDERVGQRKGRTSASNKPTQGSVSAESFSVQTLRDASQKAGMNFEALPGTRREAEAILQLLPANTKMQALDFEANKTKVLDSNLSQYRIVHFATHGILNTTRPELSAVVLSLVDPKGRPENGFLRLRIVA
ncbi:MAG: tetratricopeptide repeat protein [Acaryochloris sp. RU_4_1]|nr:tetratricopeptide repeat protein [Acaryochloris sp. RU_4_1]